MAQKKQDALGYRRTISTLLPTAMKTAQVSLLMPLEYRTSSDSLRQVFGLYDFSLDHQSEIIQGLLQACEARAAGR
jgi:hypothetical protein